jgi:hypothetical protein
MATIPANRRAQAAFSTRAHARVAAAPEVPVAWSRRSNMLSNLPKAAGRDQRLNPRLWMKSALWISRGPNAESVSVPC